MAVVHNVLVLVEVALEGLGQIRHQTLQVLVVLDSNG
jgi:hypothetical protein